MKQKCRGIVSVIIPVYNVAEYLDECLNSVVNQSYSEIEIILINDGSTDGSDKICEKWAEKEQRIRYVSKNNEGLGATRNLGIKLASGDYLAFIDSDDWIDEKFIEELYLAALEENASISECDFYRVFDFDDLKRKNYVACNGIMGREFDINSEIIYGSVSMCNKLTKRELWIQHKIQMPSIPNEDIAVCALLLALSGKVSRVNKPLYYYRKSRSGSLSASKESYCYVLAALGCLFNAFRREGLFDAYKNVLQRMTLRWLSRYLTPCLTLMSLGDYKGLRETYCEFLNKEYPERDRGRYLLFGGYNLIRIVNKLPLLEDPYNRINFSSIISVMSGEKQKIEIKHNNPYRQYMILRDFDKEAFMELLSENPNYIFIDFLEERHSIIEYRGAYYTRSDAFEEAEADISYTVLSRSTDECDGIWKEACLRFIKLLQMYFKPEHVVLVENYLTEQYGNLEEQYRYEDARGIRAINQRLKMYYDFFKEHYEGITVVKAFEETLYFTDENYEYGRYPWHLNELVNQAIAERIREKLQQGP